MTIKEQLSYVAGFFAENGIPSEPEKSSTLYIQFVQKDPKKLELIKEILRQIQNAEKYTSMTKINLVVGNS